MYVNIEITHNVNLIMCQSLEMELPRSYIDIISIDSPSKDSIVLSSLQTLYYSNTPPMTSVQYG